MTLMNSKERILAIKQTPLTWKELDIITAAERYMEDAIKLPMVTFVLSCFPKIDKKNLKKITQVWRYNLAVFHLTKKRKESTDATTQTLLHTASRIYEQEAQRILGSIFPLEHPFWKAFYKRQETDLKKTFVAIDALHFYTNCQEKIAYQLLTQSLKAILQGQHETAERLLMDLPLEDLKSWLQSKKTV